MLFDSGEDRLNSYFLIGVYPRTGKETLPHAMEDESKKSGRKPHMTQRFRTSLPRQRCIKNSPMNNLNNSFMDGLTKLGLWVRVQ